MADMPMTSMKNLPKNSIRRQNMIRAMTVTGRRKTARIMVSTSMNISRMNMWMSITRTHIDQIDSGTESKKNEAATQLRQKRQNPQ